MNNNSPLEITTLINLIREKRKTFIILILSTAVISTIISYIIPPKYKTIAVVYPVHLSPYSEESQTEQLLQFLKSITVRDVVIKKMDLINHYKIDTTKSDYKSLLNSLYKKNITFSPTLYESIEIEVIDEKPEMTKAIAECIIQTTDSFILALKKKVIIEEYTNYQKEIDILQKKIDSLNNLIVSIQNKYNILDAHNQAKYLSKKIISGKLNEKDYEIADILKNQKEYISILQKDIKKIIKQLNKLEMKKNKLQVDLNGNLHFVEPISPPYVPDKRHFPIRWVIVSLSELAVISIFVIYLLYTQKIKR